MSTESDEIIIDAEGVKVNFGDFWALKGVDIQVRKGEIIVILGPSGSGKSTFISSVSHARPKIADYPFTTLVPQLGVVRNPKGDAFVVADIPGIIEGAHQGKGLGDRFLKHVERTAMLLICLLYTSPSPRDRG